MGSGAPVSQIHVHCMTSFSRLSHLCVCVYIYIINHWCSTFSPRTKNVMVVGHLTNDISSNLIFLATFLISEVIS
jgi:hypothetical protein